MLSISLHCSFALHNGLLEETESVCPGEQSAQPLALRQEPRVERSVLHTSPTPRGKCTLGLQLPEGPYYQIGALLPPLIEESSTPETVR